MCSEIRNFKKFLLLLLLIDILLLTGCLDQREVDDLAYPIAMGLDIGEANRLRLTLQLVSPLAIGSQEGGGGGGGESGGESATNVTVDAPSIFSGLNMINNILSKQITTSHTKVIVISRRLAEAGIEKYLHAVERGREFRPSTFVVVSNDPADVYLKNVKPLLESSPAKFYEMLLGKDFSSFYPTVRIHEFYFKSESNSVQPVAILTGLGKYEKTEELKDSGKDNKDKELKQEGEYVAGNIPIIADQKSEVMGAAVFKDKKMVGILNGAESVVYQMVTGDFKYSYMTIADPYDKNYIIVLDVTQRRKPAIDVEMVEGIANIHIKIDLEADFTSIQSGLDYEKYPEIVEQEVKKLIEKKVLKMLEKTRDELNSDICGIGNIVKRKFLTWDSWQKFDWHNQYKNAKFKVDVKFRIRRTGLMVKSEGKQSGLRE